MEDSTQPDFVALTAELVAAYVSNNRVSPYELPGLIVQVHTAFNSLSRSAPAPVEEQSSTKPTPAQIRKSITPDTIISFVDGKPYKTLKRHLSTHGLSFQTYRERYGLPADYPSVASSYSAQRSALAKNFGLGNKGFLAGKAAAKEAAAVKPKRAARSRKATEAA